VSRAPEPLERRFDERRDLSGELRGHCVLDGHMRPVTASGPQALARQEGLSGHPIGVIGRHVGPIDVAHLECRNGGGLDPQRGAGNLSMGQNGEIRRCEAF
jgi:hypothetical protein